MKVRSRVRCERCKLFIEIGEHAVRFHGRLWHSGCARAYIDSRRERQPVAA